MRTFKLASVITLASSALALSACSVSLEDENGSVGESGFSTSAGSGESGGWGEEGDESQTGTDSATGDGDSDTDGTTGGDTDTGAATGDEPEPEPEPPEPEPEESSESESETETGEPLCDDMSDVVLYLSPDDSNSMSSPVQVRERVLTEGGSQLSGVPVRVWEFMNYYGFPYDPAAPGELSLYAAMQLAEGAENTYQLQLAVASQTMTPDDRPPMNVTLVMDTSGSMAGKPMELLKETCYAIASSLQLGDKVSMVEWDVDNVWSLAGYEVEGPDDALLLDKCMALEAGGGTNLNGGLTSGYELAQANFELGAVNRIVLVSDGGANAGVTDIDLIAQNAEYGGSDGIYMVGVGVDKSSNYNDELMNAVTDAGKGASVFLPSAEDVWEVFGTNFENTMAIAGRNVQVELTMPPGFEIVKFSGEEFSGDPTEVEPQHIAPNDAMVFYQQVETCAPEILDDSSEITVTANWTDPFTFEDKTTSQTWTFTELYNQDEGLLLKGAAVLAYAESLKAYKQALNDEQKTAALSAAFDAMAPAQAARPDDEDLLEIAMILAQLNP